MVWMDYFCYFCSVRLGVITSATLALIETLIFLSIFLMFGITEITNYLFSSTKSENTDDNPLVTMLINFFPKDPEQLQTIVLMFVIAHMLSCLLAIYASIKLLKHLLLPFILVEFVRILVILLIHIVCMMLLKQMLSLGLLIVVTIAGGFMILLMGYIWASAVALYQIIGIIETENYKMLYEYDTDADNYLFYKNSLGLSNDLRNQEIFSTDHRKSIDLFNYWHINELPTYKKSNLLKF